VYVKVAMALSRQMCEQSKFCDFDTEGAYFLKLRRYTELGLHIGYKNFMNRCIILTHVELTALQAFNACLLEILVAWHRQEIDLVSYV